MYTREMGTVEDVKVCLTIYSTVDKATERAREEGSDAIRLKFETASGSVIALDAHKYEKILRKDGWETRLQDRVSHYMDIHPAGIKTCSECGRPMLIRKSGGDWFAGCSGWSPENPDCENTEPL